MNVFNRFAAAIILAAMLIAVPTAFADQPVKSLLAVTKIALDAAGKEVRVPATGGANPGEILEYTVTYRNVGRAPVKDLAATIPVPRFTAYLHEGSFPQGILATLDGKKFEAVPLKRLVKKPDGSAEWQVVPYAEYRALRWPAIALEPGKEARFSARVRIDGNAPSGPSKVSTSVPKVAAVDHGPQRNQ
jgi:uncharacterized repeat protein (TIGR01451 family)